MTARITWGDPRDFWHHVEATHGRPRRRQRTQLGLYSFERMIDRRLDDKRVYRLMKQNGLLLAPHTGMGRQRAHDGVVRTLRSNLRWCSDVFEVPCWNGETVRVAFVLDTCDREAITWTATTSGIAGEQVRDLMVEAVERRFGSVT